MGEEHEYRDAAARMLVWAGLHRRPSKRLAAGAAACEPVQQLIHAGLRLMQCEAAELKELLRRSGDLLAPFDDPLQADFGAHRWLKGQREENYSDWLVWILCQIPTAEELFRLLGLAFPQAVMQGVSSAPCISREAVVEAGRLDIVIRYTGRALIVVEVKCQDVETDYGAQLKRYQNWMDSQREPYKRGVLVTTTPPQTCPPDLQVRLWREIAWGLRRLGGGLRARQKCCEAAMTLAFAGAVEQNLLGLPARPLAGVSSGRVWDLSDTVSHLKGFFRATEAV